MRATGLLKSFPVSYTHLDVYKRQEVYLGDLGALPEGEQAHWLANNVPPEGMMDEGRFRRDFLNQSVGSPDPLGDLRRARRRAAEATSALLGSPVWRELDPQAATEFEALLGPTSNDPSAPVSYTHLDVYKRQEYV